MLEKTKSFALQLYQSLRQRKKPKTLPYRQGFLNKKAWNFRKNTKAAAVLNEIARKKL